ncbi:ArsR/SmtB family transcription factor [Streptomyces longwoodensis]|uniref:ArsR/SmtB family transcription factor n=1 Tax=Streptomyces longwoodensis TaxID=68231 RepID=UPI0033E01409
MSEAVMSLQLLRRKNAPAHSAWRRHVLGRLPARTPLLGALVPAHGWVPDFLTPGGQAAPGTEAFDAIRSTPRHRLVSDLQRLALTASVPAWAKRLAEGEQSVLDGLTDALAAYYDVAITPFAATMRALLDADRAHRSRTMTQSGVGALLTGLHPGITWNAPVLELPMLDGGDFHLQGRGLLLCPHVFCGPKPRALLNSTDAPVLIYPPVGAGRTGGWDAADTTRGTDTSAAGALLGRTRAAVLDALSDPSGCTTTQLALQLGISAASVSEHTRVLRTAGLISSSRRANSIAHTATALGLQLLDGMRRASATDALGPDER